MRGLEKLRTLQPGLASLVEEVLRETEEGTGLEWMVVEAYRRREVQMAYYAQGRLALWWVNWLRRAAGLYEITVQENGGVITQLDGVYRESAHQSRRAVDCVPVRDGRLWWAAPEDVWLVYGEAAEERGFVWGGRWPDLRDYPHIEWRGA